MNTEKYKIFPLPKEQWKNTNCDPPISHYPEEGEPDYYPLHGFHTCDKFGITTMDGKNFDGFMGIYQKLSGA